MRSDAQTASNCFRRAGLAGGLEPGEGLLAGGGRVWRPERAEGGQLAGRRSCLGPRVGEAGPEGQRRRRGREPACQTHGFPPSGGERNVPRDTPAVPAGVLARRHPLHSSTCGAGTATAFPRRRPGVARRRSRPLPLSTPVVGPALLPPSPGVPGEGLGVRGVIRRRGVPPHPQPLSPERGRGEQDGAVAAAPTAVSSVRLVLALGDVVGHFENLLLAGPAR